MPRGGAGGIVARSLAALGGAFPLAAMQLWPTFRLARLAAAAARLRVPLRLRGDARSTWSASWRPGCSSARRSGGRWSGTRSTRRPRSIWPTSASCRSSWRSGRSGTAGGGRRRCGLLALSRLVTLAAEPRAVRPGVPGLEPVFPASRSSGRRRAGSWRRAWPSACLAGLGFDALRVWPRPGRAALPVRGSPGWSCRPWSCSRSSWLWGAPGGRACRWSRRCIDRVVRRLSRGMSESAFERGRAGRLATERGSPGAADLGPAGGAARSALAAASSRTQRFAIYRQELGGLGLDPRRPDRRSRRWRASRFFAAGLVVLTVLDLWLDRPRAPRRPRADRAARRAEPRARAARERAAGRRGRSTPLRNMPMVVGAAPVSAYRTLDLPALEIVTADRPAGAGQGRRRSPMSWRDPGDGRGCPDLRPA